MDATRRRAIRAAGLAVVGCSGGVLYHTTTGSTAGQQGVTEEWRQYRRDAGHTGVVDQHGPAGGVRQRWRERGRDLRGRPVVADGLVIVGVETDRRTLAAFDAATGAFAWDTRLSGTYLAATPAVVGDTVVALIDEALCGVGLRDGALRWQREMDTGLAGGVAAVDGTAFATEHRWVSAVSPADGSHNWRTEVGYTESCPTVADGSVYVPTKVRDGGRLHVLDADTGAREWTLSVDHRLLAPPVVADGTVFLTGKNGVTAVSTADERVVWRFRPDVNWDAAGRFVVDSRSPPAATARRVFVPVPDGTLYVLDAVTGERVWATQLWGHLGAPLVASETVFVASDDSYLYGLDRSTGQRRWERDYDGAVVSPALVDGTLLVTAGDGSLTGLEGA